MRGFLATLSDGTVYSEEDLATADTPGWIALKTLAKSKNLKIVDLILIFDHQRVYVPKYSKVYFYKKTISSWLDLNLPEKLEYGIGAQDKVGEVTITWYDGNSSREEVRKVNAEDLGFFINE